MAKSKSEKGSAPANVQYAALPWRVGEDGKLQILLITTRRTRRWIIPKGAPIKGMTATRAAAQEAFEEAGVRGQTLEKPFGSFRFRKTLEGAPDVVCLVKVFLLQVKTQLRFWPESRQRDVVWVEPRQACALVGDEGLRLLIARFASKAAPKGQRGKKARLEILSAASAEPQTPSAQTEIG